MKDQGKPHAINKRTFIYALIGSAAILLALVVIVTASALSGRNNELKAPVIDDNTQNEEPTPTPPPDDTDKPTTGDNTFALPVFGGSVLNDYGFFYNKTLNTYYHHKGIDYAAEEGTKVVAAFSGVVEGVYLSDVLFGNRIVIDHGNGVKTVYDYIEVREDLKVGDEVEKGEEIGTIAAPTGNEYKDGAHLHFEVWKDGKSVDPNTYFDGEEK
jgi:murein DD-endopeptidase MepM/ murein hydrolase activator NlpD